MTSDECTDRNTRVGVTCSSGRPSLMYDERLAGQQQPGQMYAQVQGEPSQHHWSTWRVGAIPRLPKALQPLRAHPSALLGLPPGAAPDGLRCGPWCGSGVALGAALVLTHHLQAQPAETCDRQRVPELGQRCDVVHHHQAVTTTVTHGLCTHTTHTLIKSDIMTTYNTASWAVPVLHLAARALVRGCSARPRVRFLLLVSGYLDGLRVWPPPYRLQRVA
jgi:hypothetical protein